MRTKVLKVLCIAAAPVVCSSAMADTAAEVAPSYTPSVYYSEVSANCPIDKAWKLLLDYQAWNPTFIGANVHPVKGKYRSEGELVLIKKQLKDASGATLPEFYAETIKVVPQSHIVWYVYMKEGDPIRNFVDFGLTKTATGTRFNVYYYAQNRISGEALAKEREHSQKIFDETALAFKKHCEALK